MQDIHDIRPPVMTGTDPALVKLLLISAAVLLGIALIVLLVRLLKKRGKKGPAPELVPSIPPLDRAMADLDRLAEGQMPDSGIGSGIDPRAFYFELARIVKTYMGEVFGANCLEMTTPELIRAVKGLDLSQGLKREISLFQELSDPFRYAPVAPSPEQRRNDLARARSLVTETDRETAPAAPEEEGR